MRIGKLAYLGAVPSKLFIFPFLHKPITMPQPTTSEQDQIAKQARAEYDAGLLYRHDREKAWNIIEDFYFNRVKKTLKSKFNVPVPILPGFVDTWQAKMSKHANLTF